MASVNLNALSSPMVSDTQREKAIADALSKLEQDISSGNSSAAQQDYATLKSQLPDTSPATSAQNTAPSISLEQLFDQLGGGVQTAQTDAGRSATVALQRELASASGPSASARNPLMATMVAASTATGATLDTYI